MRVAGRAALRRATSCGRCARRPWTRRGAFRRPRRRIDLPRTLAARTFWEFDDAANAPLHGFAGADDYYARASSLRLSSRRSTTPSLCLSAEDDPFLPREALDRARGGAAPSIEFRTTPRGGHIGWVAGVWPARPVYYAERAAVDWLSRRGSPPPAASLRRGRGPLALGGGREVLRGRVGVDDGAAAHDDAVRDLGVLADRRDAEAVGRLLAGATLPTRARARRCGPSCRRSRARRARPASIQRVGQDHGLADHRVRTDVDAGREDALLDARARRDRCSRP